MKYGIKTTARFKYPFVPYGHRPALSLSDKARLRLSWMDYIEDGNSVRKTSRHFGIAESTVRYWRKKYKKWRLTSLEDRSRKPTRVRECKVPFETIERVVELRQEYGWGKRKLQVLLKREGIHIGQTRIQKIINIAGLKRISTKRRYTLRKNRQHMYSVPPEVMKQPGGLVYLDVKHLRLIRYGPKVYQFTAIDHATRLLRIKVFSKITSRCGKLFLDYLQKRYPFKRILYLGSDNGSEFLGDLEKELTRRNIAHVFSTPRSPKQNPFVERVIRTTIDEVYKRIGTEKDMKSQQIILDRFVKVYNEIRPHESLGLKTPLEVYKMLRKT
jgi:putative transposase